jgi:hypothetical protein
MQHVIESTGYLARLKLTAGDWHLQTLRDVDRVLRDAAKFFEREVIKDMSVNETESS